MRIIGATLFVAGLGACDDDAVPTLECEDPTGDGGPCGGGGFCGRGAGFRPGPRGWLRGGLLRWRTQ